VQISNDYLILNKKHGVTHENADYLRTVTTTKANS